MSKTVRDYIIEFKPVNEHDYRLSSSRQKGFSTGDVAIKLAEAFKAIDPDMGIRVVERTRKIIKTLN
jgi:hypothetical protein